MKKLLRIAAFAAALFTSIVFCFSGCATTDTPSPSLPSTPSADGSVSITMFKKPSKLSYYVGEAFDPSGMIIKLNYEDGSSVNVLYADCTYNKNPLTEADKEIVVSYGERSVSVPISVTAIPEIKEDDDLPELERIKLVKNPNKTEYVIGESFDPNGVVVRAVYSDGTEKPVSIADLTYDKSPLKETDTSVELSYEGFKVKVNVTVSKYSVNVTDATKKTYRLEAETADTSKMTLNQNYPFVKNDAGSGGGYLSNMWAHSGSFSYTIYSEVDAKTAIYFCTSHIDDFSVANSLGLAWNGTSFSTAAVAAKTGSSYTSFTSRTYIATLTLKKGENVLTLTKKTNFANLDYIEFVVGDESLSCDLRMSSGESRWKVEAEYLTVAGTPANGKTSFTEGNGSYLCCLGKSGNTITITIWSDAERTVSVLMNAGHAYSGDFATLAYGDTFSTTLNGTAVTLSGQFTATGWTTFAESSFGNVKLAKGLNTLVLTVKAAHVPNIDYFAFAAV